MNRRSLQLVFCVFILTNDFTKSFIECMRCPLPPLCLCASMLSAMIRLHRSGQEKTFIESFSSVCHWFLHLSEQSKQKNNGQVQLMSLFWALKCQISILNRYVVLHLVQNNFNFTSLLKLNQIKHEKLLSSSVKCNYCIFLQWIWCDENTEYKNIFLFRSPW